MRSGAVLTFGSLAASAASFIRNIIVARLISVDDFGIAATFAMTMSLVEMSSNIGLDRLLVQAPDGDDPKLQATCQAFQAFRGLLAGLVMFACAGPIAALFGIPDVVWAFRLLAIAPVLRGLVHLDMFRSQRTMRFGPSASVDAIPQLIVTAAAAPLALWLGDFRVMLWVVLGQVALCVLVSHVVAERRYAWTFDRAIFRRMMAFGWPLLINGFLMFGIFQGDRAIVGASFEMQTLGWFSAAYSLTLLPSMILAKIFQAFFLPQLSRAGERADGSSNFDRKAVFTIGACLAVAAALATGTWIAGAALLELLYGERYLAGATVIGWLGIMQGARLAKAGPAIVAMSKARTTIPMTANILRAAFLFGALLAAVTGQPVEWIAIAGLCGESAGFLASLWLLKGKNVCRLKGIFNPIAASAGLIVAVGIGWTYVGNFPIWADLIAGVVVSIAATGAVIVSAPACRSGMITALGRGSRNAKNAGVGLTP